MKILQTQALQGPNYWSVSCPKLIVVLLDLEAIADGPSDTLPGFYDSLVDILPSLKEKICAPEYQATFLGQAVRGSMMGQILKQVALELQTLAGMPVTFGSTCETAFPGTYHIAVEYQNEEAGRYAIRAALRLCQSIIDQGTYPPSELQIDLDDLQKLRRDSAQGASTEALIQEAENRGIPWMHLQTCDLFQFGFGRHQRRVQAALTSHSNVLGVELACDKERTKAILTSMGAPVPKGTVIYAIRELENAIDDLGGYPIVIKPLNGNQGRGITINIQSWRQAEFAYDRAKEISDGVIVEHFYQGRDHRILVVNHKVVAVAERVPAHVVGNGQDTILTLVERENQDSRRGEGHDTSLTQIKLDAATDEMLSRQGFALHTVLQSDQICYLRANANLSTGGTAIDRTDEIHPDTVWLAERASRIIDLDIVGIDVITTDITQPLKDVDGVIVEVNAAPGLRMHMDPSEGVARNVAAPILEMLFPAAAPTQIPIVAVAESGTEAPTPLIAHIFSQAYDAVGHTSADGVYVGNHPVKKGDGTQAQSAELILQDPTVDIAVLEISRSHILRSGLAFQHCDVGVVLNVAADRKEACTLDQRALSVIAGAVHSGGYAVLNADDARVVAMAGQVQGKIAYFSMDPDNAVVRSHLQQGGIAAVYERGYLSIVQGDDVQRIENVANLPFLARSGPSSMMAHSLAACLTTYVQGMNVEQIRAALQTYQSTDQQPPEPQDWSHHGDRSHLLKLYLDSKHAALQTERLPQLERLPMMGIEQQPAYAPSVNDTSGHRSAMTFKQPWDKPYPAIAWTPQPLFQLAEPDPLKGFRFWGTFIPAAPDLQRLESRLNVISKNKAQSEQPAIASEYSDSHEPLSALVSNDLTQLWVEFESRLKPQNVLRDYTLQASMVAVAPTITRAAGVSETPSAHRSAVHQVKQTPTFTDGMRTQIEVIPSKVAAADQAVGRLHRTLTAFAIAIKNSSFQASVAGQDTEINRWVKDQAPAAIGLIQTIAEQVLDRGGTVVAIAWVLTRATAKVTFKLGKRVGAISREKLGTTTPSMDAKTLDQTLRT